ncbi:F-box/WD repeat-containing protein 7-like isoform X2 [Ambystoma mexicanum]|uniref:F-box/WD repeat-containing protein 7-like isoform X2 n=1 Tax=Ambystoma mexicanum TaxID=8296 RepID=UPI0037E9613E
MAVKVGPMTVQGLPSELAPGDRAAQALMEVEQEAELDTACTWLDRWSHRSRCQVLEHLLLHTDPAHLQQLWTDLQPVLHRDFMYAAGKLYPGFRFTPVSTELSRKMSKPIQEGRVGRKLYRIPSVFLRDAGDVRRHNTSRGSPAMGSDPPLKGQDRLPPLPMLRSFPTSKATAPAGKKEPLSYGVHLPALPNNQHAVMACDVRQPGRVKVMAAQSSWKMRNEKDRKGNAAVHLSLEKHRPRDSGMTFSKVAKQKGQMSARGLTVDQENLIRWYESHWSYKQKSEFLQKLLLQLDPRQHYYMSSFLVVMHYKDFIGDLPRKVSLQILGLLSPWDLLRACQVSRSWYQLCSCDDVWRSKCEDPALGLTMRASALAHCKKEFKRRYCTRRNWQKGACRSEAVVGHTAAVLCLALRDNLLASGSQDHTIRVWQLPGCTLKQTLQGHQKGIWGLQFFTENLLVSASSDSSIKIWNIRLSVCLRTLFGHNGPVWCIAVADGLLVSGSQDSKIKVWDLRHCQPIRTLRGHSKAVLSVALDQDSRRVYSGSADKCLRIWDLDSARCLKVMWPTCPDEMPTGAIMSISVASGYLACCADAWIWLYHLGTGKCLHTYRHNEKRMYWDCCLLILRISLWNNSLENEQVMVETLVGCTNTTIKSHGILTLDCNSH